MEGRERNRRRRSGMGWLPGVFGAALLIVVGFAVGLVVGASWEEPELLVSHARNRTEVVPLTDVAAPPATSAGIESSPLGSRPEAPKLRGEPSAPAPKASPAPSATAAPPPGAFAVQVGAFVERLPAENLARKLRDKGIPVYVAARTSEGSHRWRVRAGPVHTRGEAEQLAAQLKRDERLPTWVVGTDGG